MMKVEKVEGWAVASRGKILVKTISDTRRAAIVNWLVTEGNILTSNTGTASLTISGTSGSGNGRASCASSAKRSSQGWKMTKPTRRRSEPKPKIGRPKLEDRDKTLTALQPWAKAGISRASWYRRRKAK